MGDYTKNDSRDGAPDNKASASSEGVRINKYLSEAGICSRREADRLVEAGQVSIDGETAQAGDRVFPGQKVVVAGTEAKKEEEDILLAFYKPKGVECTSDRSNPDNIIDYIGYGKRIYTIGRLDKNSSGLILLTNNGDLAYRIAKAGDRHEKEYVVAVDKPVTEEFLSGMAGGVPILDTVTAPAKIRRTGERTFDIILIQGMNRQIRRMCEYFGYRVVNLKRIRVMNISLGNLERGRYREVSPQERRDLYKLL
ncbi:MAG: pseudouridine synthase [Lachnospiraceae bacterium]|nr:pseudouridine synthase [Lachnospiraceae bacterium]